MTPIMKGCVAEKESLSPPTAITPFPLSRIWERKKKRKRKKKKKEGIKRLIDLSWFPRVRLSQGPLFKKIFSSV